MSFFLFKRELFSPITHLRVFCNTILCYFFIFFQTCCKIYKKGDDDLLKVKPKNFPVCVNCVRTGTTLKRRLQNISVCTPLSISGMNGAKVPYLPMSWHLLQNSMKLPPTIFLSCPTGEKCSDKRKISSTYTTKKINCNSLAIAFKV